MKLFKAIIVAASAFALIFLCGAFSEWSLNPGQWPSDSRGMIAWVGLLFSGMATVFYWTEFN